MESNRLKAVFVAVYPIVVILVGVGSLIGLAASEARLAWGGALLTVLPFVVLYARSALSGSVARTSRHLPVASALTAAGALLAVYGFRSGGGPALVPLLAAAAGMFGFFLYNFWYSSLGKRLNERLEIGRTLPDFRAREADHREVRASDLRGRPALFMFYRGNWCPFCMAQVKEITARYRELTDLGVELVLVSPQPTELTQRVARMFGVPCRFWVDEGLTAAGELGIVHREGVPPGTLRKKFGADTVLPTVVIVDGEGRILFTDQTDNYRVRPEPDVFLRVFQSRGFGAGAT